MVNIDGSVRRWPISDRSAMGEIQRTPPEGFNVFRRNSILDAMAALVAERGVAASSVELVAARARVSRRTFYACFDGFDDCLLTVMRGGLERAGAAAARALEGEEYWLDGLRAALAAVLTFFDSEPAIARVCVVESLGGGPVVREHRERFAQAFRSLVLERLQRDVPNITPQIGDAVMSCALGAIYAHIVTDQPGPLVELHGQLMGLIVALYVGSDELARELARAQTLTRAMLARGAAAAQADSPRASLSAPAGVEVPDLLLEPRAHRVRLCLLYVVEHPGVSNQEVGEGIGVAHRGQLAGLLGRLATLGLLVKLSGGPGRANAWSATIAGEQVALMLAGKSEQSLVRA